MQGKRSFAVLLAVVCSLAPALAQTTGGVNGSVTDETGAGLAGVTVTAASAALQGTRVAVSDGRGEYRLVLLPPGAYSIRFELAGFLAAEVAATVALGRDATLDQILYPATAGEIDVVADLPTIDTRSTALGTNLSTRAIEALPSGRNYATFVQIAPGTSSDANPENKGQSTITVYGSTGAENSFFIDGVNTTAVEYGFQGKELNFEFIQEIDVKTGGYEAEYGRSTGGIINVITKSGGNEFHGDVFGYTDSDSLQSTADPVVSTGGTVDGFTREDFGLDLGGYLVKDRLWFFAAYDRVDNSTDSILPGGPLSGQIVESTSQRDLGSAKLTFSAAPGHTLVASYFQDPREDAGAINDASHTLNGEPSTYLGRQDFGGSDYALRYDGVFANTWILSAQVARHEEENSVGPSTAEGAGVQLRDAQADFFQSGGFGLVQTKEFQRDFYGSSVSRLFGHHEVKAGLEYEQQGADVVKRMSGGQQVDVFANPENAALPIYSHFYWTTPDATVGNAPLSALVASPEHENTTFYLQDRWQIRPNLSLNLGIRWDRQQIVDASGVERIDLANDYAPRLGLVWDPSSQHRSKVYASYGKYYEQIPMDLVIRSFSFERQARIFNFDATSNHPDAAAEAALGRDSAIFGGFTEPVEPDLENQYIDEVIVGYEREVATDLAVGVRGIWREYGQVIEDFLCADDGTYCIGNPGEGIMSRVFTLDYSRTFPAPRPEREYRGVQLDVTKRFSDNWQAMASYVYSRLEGNFDGLYAPFTNVGADPNITAAYDYYDFFTDGANLDRITNDGPLSNDRRHQFKVSGYYLTPFKLSIGASAYYRSGTPVTRYGYSDIYGRYEFFLSERGAEGRTPSNYEMDVNFSYPIEAGPATVHLLLSVFNLLDAQRPVLVDQRWGFQEADNASPTPVNPGYGEAVLRTPPTSVRIGVRVSF